MKSTFSHDKRLCNRLDYKQVFDHNEIKVNHYFLLILAKKNTRLNARLGVVVAKKHVKKAYKRNRIKRHIRESFRLKQQTLKNLDIVVLIRKGLDELDDKHLNQLLFKQWNQLANRLIKMK